nr:ATP-binding protein [Geodermatophilaceae bacterium]
ALGREALLQGAGLVAGPVERLAEVAPEALRRLAGLPVPVVVVGTSTWDPGWSEMVPLATDAPALTVGNRTALWARALAGHGDQVDPAAITAHFVLGPEQVSRAVRAASAAASLTDAMMTAEDLRRGARAQNAAGLERLARRIEPAVGWDDVVLPKATVQQLHDLAGRARHRDLVLTEWRMRPGGGRGHGITALFAGDSGTGKTMSAEVIAGELGLDLYTINLATVVDKYIGETEKNLERIFAEASGVNAVLLFDEADAIFGKRSEVRDAHDRYANIESAYLLQRMETFDGLAILATNLRANIDDAFTRRLDTIIDFPAPDEDLRLALWERCLAPPLPCGDDLDLQFCARAFTLSGGNIRSAAITAAYLAADAGQSIGMTELTAAVQQEYRKLGRLVLEREFGPYLAAWSAPSREVVAPVEGSPVQRGPQAKA